MTSPALYLPTSSMTENGDVLGGVGPRAVEEGGHGICTERLEAAMRKLANNPGNRGDGLEDLVGAVWCCWRRTYQKGLRKG